MSYSDLLTAGFTDPNSVKGRASIGYLSFVAGLMWVWIAYIVHSVPDLAKGTPFREIIDGGMHEVFGVLGAILVVLGIMEIAPIVIAARKAQKEDSG